MEYRGLPVYNVQIDIEDPELGLTCNSLVAEPAVCIDFLAFSEAKKVSMVFATEDGEKRIISGVSLLADTPIYRADENGGFYVVFTKETIRQLVEKYSKDGYNNITSLQHNGENIDCCILVESYFIDKERGICPKEFAEIPDGSWITSYKVTDDDLWEQIKNSGELNGFSVEVNCTLEPAKEDQHLEEEAMTEEDKAIMELIKWLEGEEDIDLIFEDDKKKDELKFMTVGNVLNYLNEGKICEVTVNGKDTWCQLYNVTGTGEEAKVQVFVPDAKRLQIAADEMNISGYYREANVFSNGDKWKTIKIDDIDRIRPSKLPCVSYNYDLPSFKPVVEPYDPNKTTKTEVQGAVDSIEYAMDNNLLVMLKYNDESDEPATGMRQILIGGWGQTLRNNDAIVAYEYYGDSSTGIGGGAWRIFLTRRIQSFKVNTLAEPIFIAPTGYNNSDSWDNMGMLYKRAKFLM